MQKIPILCLAESEFKVFSLKWEDFQKPTLTLPPPAIHPILRHPGAAAEDYDGPQKASGTSGLQTEMFSRDPRPKNIQQMVGHSVPVLNTCRALNSLTQRECHEEATDHTEKLLEVSGEAGSNRG